MEAIKDVWFDNNRIYIKLEDGMTYNRPLEAFPTLMEVTDDQRNAYEINRFGDAIRWRQLDEDIHVSSFLETSEPCRDNNVAQIFQQFPWLNITEVARMMNIHKSVLLSYIYGMKEPSTERMKMLRETLHLMGVKMMSA